MIFCPFIIALFYLANVRSQEINVKELRCLVCQRLVEEMEKEIEKVDPLKKIEVGTYRIDHKGDQKQKTK
uniref:Putative conserved secreted protein n=1 Tax=Panstrongylus lignarius TaxID=156445 RepID=A0A224Y690_9HEMI